MQAGEVDTNLTEWYKPKIDKKILKELSKRSNWQGLKHIIIFFILILLSGYITVVTWGTWWGILSLLVYGNIYYCSVNIQHETNHETFFKSRWLNRLFYHITCLMNGFEQYRWKWSHFHHHSYTIFTDEENYDYENNTPRPTEPIRFLINFLPLGPIINIQKLRHFSQMEIIKHALGFTAPAAKMSVPKSEMLKVRITSWVHILLWVIAIWFSFYLQSLLPILMFVLVPFYGNSLLMLFGLTQHAGLDENIKDHRKSTRTVIFNPFFSFLYCHMEYHIEHHIFPKIPCHNLKKFREHIKDQLPEAPKGLWAAYKEIIPAIFKQGKDKHYFINVKLPTTNV